MLSAVFGHETRVVFRRELKSYFLSPIAYVFGGLFLGVALYMSSASILQQGGRATMQAFFANLPWLFLLFLPGLTMRLWAEERKLGTIELLLTFPVRPSQVVLGKFFAVLAYLALVLALTLGLPLTIGAYGNLDWAPVVAGYVATLLFAGSFVAVGIFWSSMTRDQIVALLASVVTLAVLFVLGVPAVIDYLAASAPVAVADLINGLSPFKYFLSIQRGVLDSRDFVYFACFCGFFLYANVLVLEVRHRSKG